MYRRTAQLSLACLLTVVVLSMAGGQAYGQHSHAAVRESTLRVRFDRLTVEQGLSQGSVKCVIQDSKGFLWVGTDDGLNRFDGYQFLVFRPDPRNPNSLVSNVITALAEDGQGGMWIGTDGAGFQLLKTRNRHFVTPSQVSSDRRSLSSSVITALQVDRRRRLWIGTERDGLHVYDPNNGTMQAVSLSRNGRPPFVTCITSTRSGRMLVATREAGLFIIDEDGLEPRGLSLPAGWATPGEPDGAHPGRSTNVLQVLVEADRYIWISTEDGKLARHDVRTGRWNTVSISIPEIGSYAASILAMAIDTEDRIWLGTRSSGVLMYDIRRATQIAVRRNPLDAESLPGNSVRCLYRDRLGNMWVGTNGNGLGLHSPASKEFNLVAPGSQTSGDLSVHSFRAIWQGRDSVLWLGGYGGLCRVDRRTNASQCLTGRGMEVNRRADAVDLPLRTVYSLLPDPGDPNHALFVGTEGTGLYRLDTRRMQLHLIASRPGDSLDLSLLTIYELTATRDGTVWIGTEDGLYRWRQKLEPYPVRVAKEDFTSREGAIFCIVEDRNGFLWIGTERGGLAYYDRLEDQTTFFRHQRGRLESIASDNVRCVHEDRQGRLWIGTIAGLDLMDLQKGSFRHVTTYDGLPNNVIYGILEDVSGYLWLSTNKGIARYHPEEGVVATYDVHDGLQGNEFNSTAYFQSASGEMYFGGVRGVTHFFPERITRNLIVPPVVITGIREGNRELYPRGTAYGRDTIMVEHNRSSIGINFAALSYYRPEKNRYRYRIAGEREDFTDLGTDHSLGFANLSPGTYIIQIQGSNNDGVWNLTGATLTLIVHPPFWGTWWFRLLLGLLLVLGALVLVRWRLERLRHQERSLAEEVALRTSELQHANANLLREIEERKRAEAEAYRATATKSEFLAHISHEIRTPMNAILGFTELLQDRIDDEEQRRHLNSIALSGRTLLRLINDVLDLSKIEAGKLELSYQPANLRVLIQEIETLFAYQVQRKQLAFVTSVAPRVPEVMYLDEIRVRQILLNLMGNAVKFTEKGSIHLDVTSADETQERCTLIFRLSDTGVGIAPSQQERIFEPFRQGGRGRNTDYSGTGLGLSITQRLVNMMEGEITYSSRLGSGTTFKVVLPGVLIAATDENGIQEPEMLYAEHPEGMPGEDAATPVPPAESSVPPEAPQGVEDTPPPAVLQALHAELVAGHLVRWERLHRTYLMHEIEEFASELRGIGERTPFVPLRDWAERLLRDARSFDMDRLPRTLDEFPDILAELNDRGKEASPPTDNATNDR